MAGALILGNARFSNYAAQNVPSRRAALAPAWIPDIFWRKFRDDEF